MAALSETVNILGELSKCRRPTWSPKTEADFTGPPESAAAGVSLLEAGGAPATRVAIKLREDTWRRVARVTISVRDATANYTVIVDAASIATTSGAFATDDLILVELKTKITADAVVGGAAATPIIDSELLDSAGAITVGTAGGGNAAATLRIFGLAEADWSIDHSATGTGVMAVKADPSTAAARIWLTTTQLAKITANPAPGSDDWFLANDGAYALTFRGDARNLETGGWTRCYLELHTIAGVVGDGATTVVTYTDANSPIAWVGPATRESS